MKFRKIQPSLRDLKRIPLTIQDFKKDGFEGFLSIRRLKSDCSVIPAVQGIYVVLNPKSTQPKFLETGSGGYFKKKNPNVSLDKLKFKWVDKSIVVYVGKAGGNNAATLRSRISQYIKFGNGQPIGHWGGRYIWQMEDVDDLLLCWMKTPEYMPRQKEVELLSDHETKYQALPFANLRK